jgi:hypothetical protein
VSDPLEAELDQLFRLAPAEMVEARNGLADRLKKAGERAAATRVKALKRPTPVAWAINQVFFLQPGLLEQAREVTLHLRELHAQDGVEQRQLSAAVEAQRAALQAALDAAIAVCAAAGVAVAAPQQRKIFTTLQGWLSGGGDEAPGRMTHELEPSGFDALGAVGEAAPRELPRSPPSAAQTSLPLGDAAARGRTAGVAGGPPPSAAAARAAGDAGRSSQLSAAGRQTAEPKPRGPDPRELARAAAQLAELEQSAAAARQQAEQRRAEAERARAVFERTQTEVHEAEKKLHNLREQLREREGDLARRFAALDEAEQSQRRADADAARARADLAALRKKL